MTVKVARSESWCVRSVPAIAAALRHSSLFFGCGTLQTAVADGETRTISFHHIHTNEDLTVTYKVNGRYDEEALKKINLVLRDWREAEPIKMDPHLIDLLWEVHHEDRPTRTDLGGLRLSLAEDQLDAARPLARRRQAQPAHAGQSGRLLHSGRDDRGAAGRRPARPARRCRLSIPPRVSFVHLDTGSVRHWPRMPEAQLANVLKKGTAQPTLRL